MLPVRSLASSIQNAENISNHILIDSPILNDSARSREKAT
jgi:hypothetical protein